MAYEDLRAAFKEGDVVFGLNRPMLDAVDSLRRPRRIRVRSIPLFGKKLLKAKGLIQADITDVVWNSRNPSEYATDKEIKKSLVDKQLGTNFRAHLAGHVKYDVASQYREGKLVQGPGKQSPKDFTNAWGRTSKAGLEYHLKRGATVHFVVTNIDLNKVARKSEADKHSVTNRELRLLYRRRNDRSVKERVKFYDESGAIDQAVFFARPEWKNYIPREERDAVAQQERSSSKSSGGKEYWNRQVAQQSQTAAAKETVSRKSHMSLRRS
jgi:hypothetical protein